MHHQSPNTAVLVFIRDEQEEARLKLFHAKRCFRSSLQMVRTLNRHVRSITRQAGLPTFIIKGDQQVGADFGERFTNAVESIFEAGYERVIAIGNDCLSLTATHLQMIAAELERGKALVIGPAKDGGAYAIGIQQSAFDKSAFEQLPWQTEQVFAALVNYIENLKAAWSCLPAAMDVDDAISFQKALTHLTATCALHRLLKGILQSNRIPLVPDIPFISNYLAFTASLRAPPSRGLIINLWY